MWEHPWRIFSGFMLAVCCAALGFAVTYYLNLKILPLLIGTGVLMWCLYKVFWYQQIGRGIVAGSMENPFAINVGSGLCFLGAGLAHVGYQTSNMALAITGGLLTALSFASVVWGINEGPCYDDDWPI